MHRWTVGIVALFSVVTAAQQPPPADPKQPLVSGTTAVVVDVVVRDGRGDPVTDLRKDDFELLEDGLGQEIADVMVAGMARGAQANPSGEAGIATAAGSAASGRRPQASAPTPTFTALVFDRLSLDARARAVKGALASLETMTADDYIAVYVIDLSLDTVQTYTNDRARIHRALDDVARRASTLFDRVRNAQDEVAKLGDSHPDVPVVASPESVGRPVDTRESGPDGGIGWVIRMSWEALARDQQGYATTNALLAVASGLGTLPGRKSVVFFAEGLAIPDAVLPHFRDVVTTANRGNVSVYTVDGAGLRVHSKDAETGRAVRSMGAAGIEVNRDGSNQSSLAMLERNEDVLRKDPRTSLTLLADQTGGFLVEGTNDLAARLRQVNIDRRFHYLLTYTPKNGTFDGKWRTLTVRVPNRRVSVRARSGYLAVRSHGLLPLLAHEGPALAALDRAVEPADLPLRAGTFVFPAAKQSRLAVLAATDAAALRFNTDAATGGFRTDFTILARILNDRGEVVRKASQPYRLSGDATQLEQAKRGEVLFFRQPLLPPGSYTLEVALHDALAGRSSVHRSAVVVPDPQAAALQVGSLVLVRRAERVKPEERDKDNPLYTGDVLVYPNLGEPIEKSREKAATFFVVATAPPGSMPKAVLEVLLEGRAIAKALLAFPAIGSAGRVEHVFQLPVEQLASGRYTVRLTVAHGDAREVRESVMAIR